MKYLFTSLCLLYFIGISQQSEIDDFNRLRLKQDKRHLLTLGSWSLANTAVSTYGWITTENEAKYFHQMNTIWSGINLMIAVPGYIKAHKTETKGIGFTHTWKEQNKIERALMFNSALDVAYITSGLWLRSEAKSDPENYHRFRGFGNGIILQGSFLLLLDITGAIIHSQHRKKKLDPFFNKIELSDSGIGLKIKL